MKIELIGILSVLLQEETVTAPELAERFEVSRRTINRDIDDLLYAGIPIRTTQGVGGGISIADGYKMDRTILTSKDMQMILAGLRSLDSVSGSSYYSQLMEKIQTGSSEFISGRDSILIDLSSWYRDSILIDLSSWYRDSLAPKISTIQDAIEKRHLVAFTYYGPKGESNRKIEPYYIVFKCSVCSINSTCKCSITTRQCICYYLVCMYNAGPRSTIQIYLICAQLCTRLNVSVRVFLNIQCKICTLSIYICR